MGIHVSWRRRVGGAGVDGAGGVLGGSGEGLDSVSRRHRTPLGRAFGSGGGVSAVEASAEAAVEAAVDASEGDVGASSSVAGGRREQVVVPLRLAGELAGELGAYVAKVKEGVAKRRERDLAAGLEPEDVPSRHAIMLDLLRHALHDRTRPRGSKPKAPR